MLPLKKYRGADGKRSSKISVMPVTTEPAETELSSHVAEADSNDGAMSWWYHEDFGDLQAAAWKPYKKHISRKIERFWIGWKKNPKQPCKTLDDRRVEVNFLTMTETPCPPSSRKPYQICRGAPPEAVVNFGAGISISLHETKEPGRASSADGEQFPWQASAHAKNEGVLLSNAAKKLEIVDTNGECGVALRARGCRSLNPSDAIYVRPMFTMSRDDVAEGAAEAKAEGTHGHGHGGSQLRFPYFEAEITFEDGGSGVSHIKSFQDGGGRIGIGLVRMPLRQPEIRKQQEEWEERCRKAPRKLVSHAEVLAAAEAGDTGIELDDDARVGQLENSCGYYSDGRIEVGALDGASGGVAWALPIEGDTCNTLFAPREMSNACLTARPGSRGADTTTVDDALSTDGAKLRTVVGCGINIASGELFFTRDGQWVSSAHYRMLGKIPSDDVEFQPMLTLIGDCTQVHSIRLDWGKAQQERLIRANLLMAGQRRLKVRVAEDADKPWAPPWIPQDDGGNLAMKKCDIEPFPGVRVRDIPYQSHFRGIVQHVNQQCERSQVDAQERPIDEVVHGYFEAQVMVHNSDLRIGDFVEIRRAKPILAGAPELGVTLEKSGICGVVCQTPPPGGSATFYNDCLGDSYALAVLENDLIDDCTPNQSLQAVVQDSWKRASQRSDQQKQKGMFHRVTSGFNRAHVQPQRDLQAFKDSLQDSKQKLRFVEFTVQNNGEIASILGQKLEEQAETVEGGEIVLYVLPRDVSRFKSALSRRFCRVAESLPRFCANPIAAALACASACHNVLSIASKGQQVQLADLGQKFSDMAHALVPIISTTGLHGVTLLETALFPRKASNCFNGVSLEESAIAIALKMGQRKFVHAPACVEHMDNIWKGGTKELSHCKTPTFSDYFGGDIRSLAHIATANVEVIADIDFFLAPAVRFGANVLMLALLLIFQHLVVLWPQENTEGGRTRQFTAVEVVYVLLHFTFVLGELEDVRKAVHARRLYEYCTKLWNAVDFLMHSIFIVYFSLRIVARYDTSPWAPDVVLHWAYRILALNCILLWLRCTSVLTSNSSLGPLIRMMSLMSKDVIVFLVLLLMYMIGFAGTFFAWFGLKPQETVAAARRLAARGGSEVIGNSQNSTSTDGDFASYQRSFITMLKASLGDFSFEEFWQIQDDTLAQTFGILMLIIFLFVCAIMLLNLLIAILADTYTRVQTEMMETFHFEKALLVQEHMIWWNGSETVIELPPPFNAFSLLVCRPIAYARSLLSIGLHVVTDFMDVGSSVAHHCLPRAFRKGKVAPQISTTDRKSTDRKSSLQQFKERIQDFDIFAIMCETQFLSLTNASIFLLLFGGLAFWMNFVIILARLLFFAPVFCVSLVTSSMRLCVMYAVHGKQAVQKMGSSFDTAWSDSFFKLFLTLPFAKYLEDRGSMRTASVCARALVALLLLPFVFATAIAPSVISLALNLSYFCIVFPLRFFPTLHGKWLEIFDRKHLDINVEDSGTAGGLQIERFDGDVGRKQRAVSDELDVVRESSDGLRRRACFGCGPRIHPVIYAQVKKLEHADQSAQNVAWDLTQQRGDRWWPLFTKLRKSQRVVHDWTSGRALGEQSQEHVIIHRRDHADITMMLAQAVRDQIIELGEKVQKRTFSLDDFLLPSENDPRDYLLLDEEFVFYMIYHFPLPSLVPHNLMRAKFIDVMPDVSTGATYLMKARAKAMQQRANQDKAHRSDRILDAVARKFDIHN